MTVVVEAPVVFCSFKIGSKVLSSQGSRIASDEMV